MGNLRVIEGDFVQHPETGYGWGRLTVYGWKQGEKSPSRFSLVVADETAAFKLKGSEAISTGGATAQGAAQGAISGLGGGPIGIVSGVVIGAIIGAAAAESHNEKIRGDNQRFELTFADGKRLVAEGHVRVVMEIQEKAMQALTKKAKR